MRSAIWKINNDALEQKSLLPTQQFGHDIKQTIFHMIDPAKALSIVDNHFIVWDLGESDSKVKCRKSVHFCFQCEIHGAFFFLRLIL